MTELTITQQIQETFRRKFFDLAEQARTNGITVKLVPSKAINPKLPPDEVWIEDTPNWTTKYQNLKNALTAHKLMKVWKMSQWQAYKETLKI
jgi:hypothetical protein